MAATAKKNIPQISPRMKAPRSRVTSRRAVLFGVDGRSMQARRFKDLIDQFEDDLGGHDALSEGQRQLARRCAMLAAECERLEADAALSGVFDADRYGVLTDRLGRALQRIGLRRVKRDAAPTLAELLNAEEAPP